MGSIIADLRHDFVTSVVTKTNSADLDALNASYEAMKDLGDQYLSREGIAEADRYYEKSVDMRYKGQFHEVELPLPGGTVGPAMRDFMVSEFHKKHEELYGYRDEVETEVINLRRACFGRVVAPERKALSVSSYEAGKFVKSRRDVYFEDEFGFVPTQVFDGDLLQAGNIVEGPAIVEQRTTTVVVPPKARLEVTNYGDYLVIL
jgi:N-methylhydantoinase A